SPNDETPAAHLAGLVPPIIVDDGCLARAVDVAGHEADALARDPAAAAGHDRREPPAVDDEAAPLVDHLDHVAFRRQAQVIAMPMTDLARSIDAVGAGRTGGKAERKGEHEACDHTPHRLLHERRVPRRPTGAQSATSLAAKTRRRTSEPDSPRNSH